MLAQQQNGTVNSAALDQRLLRAERALLLPDGLPDRPWYRHAIYAPGMHTGYAAVVIPGVNEAIERHNLAEATDQLGALATALDQATQALQSN